MGRFGVDLESIWGRFGIWEGLGRVLGSFGVPLGAQDRILIDFRSILEPLLGPSRPQLGGLGASFGVLGRSSGGLEPFIYDPISKSSSDFMLHRFRNPERPQNHSKIN